MTETMYPNLFSPITVRGKTFKNRILLAPLGNMDPGAPYKMSDQTIAEYERIAQGGVARIVTGENDVQYGSAVSSHYWFFTDDAPTRELCESFGKYVETMHKYGALAFVHFGHMGMYSRDYDNLPEAQVQMRKMMPQPPEPTHADGTPYTYPKVYGPIETVMSEPWDGVTSQKLNMDSSDGKHVNEMTEEVMNEVADAFAHCCRAAKECGLDGATLHSGHGFIFAQWISPRFNKRTDKYGGSAENRARFPIMVLERIRKAVGEDFIIELRFSAEENINPITDKKYIPGVVELENSIEFFRELDKHPGLVDIAHISGGLHTEPVYNTRVTANSYFPMGLNVASAAAIKAAVKNIKVGVVGSMSDPDLCEEVIRDGKADFVIMARQLIIADPDFPCKAQRGEPEEIDNCLRCVICRNNDHCSVRPYELLDKGIEKADRPLKVVVVGGGIGGMKAAEYAGRVGHSVTLYEKADRLGGILNYTDADRFKTDVRRLKDNVAKRLPKLNVEIKLNTEATPELIKAGGYDAVIVACGGRELSLPVPVEEDANLITAVEAYLCPEKVHGTIAIIGGGLTGCEAAIHFADAGREVILISRSAELMRKVQPRRPADGSADTHLIWLDKLKPEIYKGYACREIRKDGVVIEGADGEKFVAADTFINASGMGSDHETAASFDGSAPVVKPIGDCVSAGLIGDAVLSAYEAVKSL